MTLIILILILSSLTVLTSPTIPDCNTEPGKTDLVSSQVLNAQTRVPQSQGALLLNFETGDDPADVFTKWDERFRDNVLSTIELFTFFWTDTGKEYYHRIKLPNVQIDGWLGNTCFLTRHYQTKP